MLMATQLSHELDWLTRADVARVRDLLAAADLPLEPPHISPQRFRELMAVDKKSIDGRLRLILLKSLGQAVISDDFDDAALTRTLAQYAKDR